MDDQHRYRVHFSHCEDNAGDMMTMPDILHGVNIAKGVFGIMNERSSYFLGFSDSERRLVLGM